MDGIEYLPSILKNMEILLRALLSSNAFLRRSRATADIPDTGVAPKSTGTRRVADGSVP